MFYRTSSSSDNQIMLNSGIRLSAIECGSEDSNESKHHDVEAGCQYDTGGDLQTAGCSQIIGKVHDDCDKFSATEGDCHQGTDYICPVSSEDKAPNADCLPSVGLDSADACGLEYLLDRDFRTCSNVHMDTSNGVAYIAEEGSLDGNTCLQMDIKMHVQPSDGENINMQEGNAGCTLHQQLQDSAKHKQVQDEPHSHSTKSMVEGLCKASADAVVHVATIHTTSDHRVNDCGCMPHEYETEEANTQTRENYSLQLWAQHDMALLRCQVFTSLLYGPNPIGVDEEDAASSSKVKRNRQRGTPNKPLGFSGGLETSTAKEGKANVSWADPDEDDSWQEMNVSPQNLSHKYLQCDCLKHQRWCDSSCQCWCHVVIAYTGEGGAVSVCL
jgi:hypothetical protein